MFPQVGHHFLHAAGRVHHTIDGHFGTRATLFANPLRDGWGALDLQFHQLELGALQLFLGCDEIAGVGPKGGTMEGYHRRSCRAVEARDELTSLPMVGDIFALMGICTGEDERRQMLAAHHLPEVC